MCCEEYQEFLDEFGGIVLGYEIITKKAHRKYLRDMIKFRRCPYCGDRLYAEKLPPKNLEGK